MRTLRLAFLFALLFLFATNSSAQWQRIPIPQFPIPYKDIVSVIWTDSLHGALYFQFENSNWFYYAKTEDAGKNWVTDTLPHVMRDYRLRYVSYRTPNVGVVSFENKNIPGKDTATFITTDAGASWERLTYPTVVGEGPEHEWSSIYLYDSTTLLYWRASNTERLHISTDLGQSWRLLATDDSSDFHRLDWYDGVTHAYFTPISPQIVYKFYDWVWDDWTTGYYASTLVRYSKDSGRTWKETCRFENHPLCHRVVDGNMPMEDTLLRMKDTSIVLDLYGNIKISKDLRFHETNEGWLDIHSTGSAIYDNGFLAYLPGRSNSTYIEVPRFGLPPRIHNVPSDSVTNLYCLGYGKLYGKKNGYPVVLDVNTLDVEKPLDRGIQVFEVYPNPVYGKDVSLTVTLTKSSPISVSVLDLLGRTRYALPNKEYHAGVTRFNLPSSSLPGGVYFVRVTTREGSTARQLVVK